jgi:hypothetical protein
LGVGVTTKRSPVDAGRVRAMDDEVEQMREKLSLYQRARMFLQLRAADGFNVERALSTLEKEVPRRA